MKSHTKIFLFITLDMQQSKFEIWKNQQHKSFVSYFDKANGYFEKINEKKYLTLIATSRGKERMKKYEVL